MPDHLMREGDPVFLWNQGHEIKFDFDRITLPGKAYTLRHAFHVGVYHDAWDAKSAPEYDVGRLTSDAGKFN